MLGALSAVMFCRKELGRTLRTIALKDALVLRSSTRTARPTRLSGAHVRQMAMKRENPLPHGHGSVSMS